MLIYKSIDLKIDKMHEQYKQFSWLQSVAIDIHNATVSLMKLSTVNNIILSQQSVIDYFKDLYYSNQSDLYYVVDEEFANVIIRDTLAAGQSVKHVNKYDYTLTTQQFYIDNNQLYITLRGLHAKFSNNSLIKGIDISNNIHTVKNVKILMKNDSIILQLTYESCEDTVMGIDPGLNNLLTVVTNSCELSPFIISGEFVAECNKNYKDEVIRLKESYESSSKRKSIVGYNQSMNSLINTRYNLIKEYITKACNYIIEKAIKHDVKHIIIGNGSTVESSSIIIGSVSISDKKPNIKHTTIPFELILTRIRQLSKPLNIKVTLTEESYTSQTSFLDNEPPDKEHGDKSRRKSNKFTTNDGHIIHADVNGAYQIIKKVKPDAYDNVKQLKLVPRIIKF